MHKGRKAVSPMLLFLASNIPPLLGLVLAIRRISGLDHPAYKYGELDKKCHARARTGPPQRFELYTRVKERTSGRPLEGVSVIVQSRLSGTLGIFTSNHRGEVVVWVEGSGLGYNIQLIEALVVKPGFETQKLRLTDLQNDLTGITMWPSLRAVAIA